MPPQPAKRELLNQDMGGELESFVRARRKAFRSWADIAYDIRATYGAEVSDESLRQWFGEPKTEAAS